MSLGEKLSRYECSLLIEREKGTVKRNWIISVSIYFSFNSAFDGILKAAGWPSKICPLLFKKLTTTQYNISSIVVNLRSLELKSFSHLSANKKWPHWQNLKLFEDIDIKASRNVSIDHLLADKNLELNRGLFVIVSRLAFILRCK